MNNPWANITVAEYEGHMKYVKQYGLLNMIFKEQLSEHPYETICVLGIGCGNGLEHIKSGSIVYGYDINVFFLNECRKKNDDSQYKLILKQADLTDYNLNICKCDIIISNLVLEYIGMDNFIHVVNNSKPNFVSVVIQKTLEKAKAISASPYVSVFDKVSDIRLEILPQNLTRKMMLIGYRKVLKKKYEITQFKYFIRVDYVKCSFSDKI